MPDMIEVKVDGDAINKALADAIIQSVLGKEILEYTRKFINDGNLRAFAQRAIENQVGEIIKNTIDTQYKEKIQEALAKQLTEERMQSVINNVVYRIVNQTSY